MSGTYSRKGFFGKILKTVGKGLGTHIEQKISEKLEAPLRPPGALEELEFLSACTRCGACSKACPFGAIQRLPLSSGIAANTPSIDPNRQACRLCEDTPCIASCADGALMPLIGPVKMGRALVEPKACMTWNDKICTRCYDACPYPESAITIDAAFHPQVLDACVGCGLCQHICPTSPKGILALSDLRYNAKTREESAFFGLIPLE